MCGQASASLSVVRPLTIRLPFDGAGDGRCANRPSPFYILRSRGAPMKTAASTRSLSPRTTAKAAWAQVVNERYMCYQGILNSFNLSISSGDDAR